MNCIKKYYVKNCQKYCKFYFDKCCNICSEQCLKILSQTIFEIISKTFLTSFAIGFKTIFLGTEEFQLRKNDDKIEIRRSKTYLTVLFGKSWTIVRVDFTLWIVRSLYVVDTYSMYEKQLEKNGVLDGNDKS